MTPVSILLDSYVRKIEQLRGELDAALKRAEDAESEVAFLRKELGEEVAEWNQKVDSL